jgi:hypothetical protein
MSFAPAAARLRTARNNRAVALLAVVAFNGAGLAFPGATPAVTRAAAPEAPASAAPAPTREEQMAWVRARSAFFDAYLAKQPRHATWAAALEAKILATTKRQQSMGVTLVSARCWTKACRAEFSYPGKHERLRHIQSLGLAYPELPTVSFAYPGQPHDETRLIAYMAKDNGALPPFDVDAYTGKRKAPTPEPNARGR